MRESCAIIRIEVRFEQLVKVKSPSASEQELHSAQYEQLHLDQLLR